jgi:hypothetical protein
MVRARTTCSVGRRAAGAESRGVDSFGLWRVGGRSPLLVGRGLTQL